MGIIALTLATVLLFDGSTSILVVFPTHDMLSLPNMSCRANRPAIAQGVRRMIEENKVTRPSNIQKVVSVKVICTYGTIKGMRSTMFALIVTVTFALQNGMISTHVMAEDTAPSMLVYTSPFLCHQNKILGVRLAKDMIEDGRIAWPSGFIGTPFIQTRCEPRGLA